jgi:plastocyanin
VTPARPAARHEAQPPQKPERRGASTPARWGAVLLAVCALCLGAAAALGATGHRTTHRACHARRAGRQYHCPARGAARRHHHKRGSHAHKRTTSAPPAAARVSPPSAGSTSGAGGAPASAPGGSSGTATGAPTSEGGLVSAPEGPPAPAPPARAQVTAKEFSLTLSRSEVSTGKVTLEFIDGGQDEHNLHIRPAAGGPDVGSFPNALPGQHLDVTFNLAPGTYTLYCSIPAHKELGMKASFTVR